LEYQDLKHQQNHNSATFSDRREIFSSLDFFPTPTKKSKKKELALCDFLDGRQTLPLVGEMSLNFILILKNHNFATFPDSQEIILDLIFSQHQQKSPKKKN